MSRRNTGAWHRAAGRLGVVPRSGSRNASPDDAPTALPDLSTYTEVPSSNVSFLPATGSTLAVNSSTLITASSSTKTITQVILLQPTVDPSDIPLQYSTQAPFSIPFTPPRLGSTTFSAIAVFSDNTYTSVPLSYTLQAPGAPSSIKFLNPPLANLQIGNSQIVSANAIYSGYPVDITQVASYASASGTSNVFSAAPGGSVVATGNGVDLLSVSFSGTKATTQIAVGACTYALNPSNQIVPNTGGEVPVQVTTQPGCAWTAAGGAPWLSITSASGSDTGVITLAASANTTSGTQTAQVTLAGLQALFTQPSTPCTFSLSQTAITAPAAGLNGTINVTTACPITVSSNATWISATPLTSSASYTVALNNGPAQRNATLTVGTQGVSVVQAGSTVAPPLSISGQVTLAGSGLAGVTVTLSGSQNANTITDSLGFYSFTAPAGGTYATSPSLAGYGFAPPSQSFAGLSVNQTASFAASCSVSINPATTFVDATSQSASLSVVAAPSCSWVASTSGGFVNIASGSSGIGNGTINISVAANATGADRAAMLTVNAATASVNQDFTFTTFSDVLPTAYYFDAVNLLAGKNITAGCGTNDYCPQSAVTRDQMAIFLVRTMLGTGTFSYSPTPYFGDVPSNYWAFPFIQKLYELGVTAGCSASPLLYCPTSTVTRDQMAVFIIRTRYGPSTQITWNATPYFADVSATSFAFSSIQRMYQDALTAGCTDSPLSYCPGNPVVRGDMAIFLMRGGFNQLLPPLEPVITSIQPVVISSGASGTFTITGVNTAFQQGATNLVFPASSGITVSSITVTSPTEMQAVLTASPAALTGPVAIYEQTEPQEAILPNSLLVQ